MSSQYLFAYGTLLTGTGRPLLDRLLTRTLDPLGPASVQGRLFDLGDYPGLVPSFHDQDRVKGTLYAMRQARKILRFVDRYEGIVPGAEQYSEFVRRRAVVVLTNTGQQREAWVYYYNRPLLGRPPVPSGDYVAYLRPTRRIGGVHAGVAR
jgi:gamma-glutamylcyclotransferase (GGCT)/AIG2-like uncharacterized protein YtfP